MKKLYSLLMVLGAILLCATNAWAQESDYDVEFEFTNTTKDNYFKDWGNGVTTSSTFGLSSGSNEYYVTIGATANNAGQNYVEISATSAIESVEFYCSSNGNNKTLQPAILGWKGTTVTNTAEADYVLVHSEVTGANKGKSKAQWYTFDVSSANLQLIRFYRQVKNITVDGTKSNFGNAQTLQLYGMRVKLKELRTEVSRSTAITGVTINGEAISATDLATLTGEGHTLNLEGNYATAPAVVFNTETVITYDDNSTETKKEAINATVAAGETCDYVATATVADVEYAIYFKYIKTYTISWGNGEKNWENVYAYVWNGDDNNSWPGTQMTYTGENGIWTVDLQGLSFEPAQVIFNNGAANDVQQTETLDFVDGKTYGALPRVITFDKSNTAWEDVYVYVWGDNSKKNAEWPGVAMTADGNTYTYTLLSSWVPTTVVFNNGNGGDAYQTVDIEYAENTIYKNASKMDETWSVNLPGEYNEWNAAAPAASPVKGIAKFNLTGVSGYFKVIANGAWHGNGQTLTLGEWVNVNDNGDNNLKFPEACNDALATVVEYNCITNEIRINVVNIVAVDGSTTWDFSAANSNQIAGANGDALEPFANYQGWAEGFNADALAAKAQYLYYKDNKCFQGTRLVFNTTVDGTVEIEFSNTGNSNGTRSICINGVETIYGSTGSKTHVTSDPIAVLAGTVEISGIQTAHDTKPETVGQPNQLRIFKVVFTAVDGYIKINFNNDEKKWEVPHVKYSTNGDLYVMKAMTKSSAHLVRTLADGIEDETQKSDIWTANIPTNATHLTFSDGGEGEYGTIFTTISDGGIYGPSGNVTGVEDIESENMNAAPVYYNLQGVRVDNPANGIFIVVRGNKTSKEIIR